MLQLFYNEPNQYQLMNTNRTRKMDKAENKKVWKSPEIAELSIDQTSQLDPPSVDDPQGS